MPAHSWQPAQRECPLCGRVMPRETPVCPCGYTVQWSVGGLWRRSLRMVSTIIAYALLIPMLCYIIVDLVPWRIEVQPPQDAQPGATCLVWRRNNESLLQRVSQCQPAMIAQWGYVAWLDRSHIETTTDAVIAWLMPIIDMYAPLFALVDGGVSRAQTWLNTTVWWLWQHSPPWFQPTPSIPTTPA
jgi:hypothetical protein